MRIDIETMNRMHQIQIEMLKVLIALMEKLNITYYFVHGSLLGAVSQNNFILEDDDIDIAIFRSDFNRLVEEANELLPKKFFIQTSLNDDFPLPFAKMRNSETTFRQPRLTNYRCNKGIYIDIFPIDYCTGNKCVIWIKNKMMNARINDRMLLKEDGIHKFWRRITCLLYPSEEQTILKRERFYEKMNVSKMVAIYGGKSEEFNIPLEWFGRGVKLKFGDIYVNCPSDYDSYLRKIYGRNYLEYNPAVARITTEGVEISADVVDFEKPYTLY